jgi:hypothetical protein
VVKVVERLLQLLERVPFLFVASGLSLPPADESTTESLVERSEDISDDGAEHSPDACVVHETTEVSLALEHPNAGLGLD